MKSWLPLLASVLCVSVAWADPPKGPSTETRQAVSALVNEQLIAPLKRAEQKRKMFSRAMPVPVQRRVRVLDQSAQLDSTGQSFVRFAIDERRGFHDQGEWHLSVSGCAYVEQRLLFVRRKNAFVPAQSMLGGEAQEQPQVCRAAPAEAAKLTAAR